jgi:hypothetical protein
MGQLGALLVHALVAKYHMVSFSFSYYCIESGFCFYLFIISITLGITMAKLQRKHKYFRTDDMFLKYLWVSLWLPLSYESFHLPQSHGVMDQGRMITMKGACSSWALLLLSLLCAQHFHRGMRLHLFSFTNVYTTARATTASMNLYINQVNSCFFFHL